MTSTKKIHDWKGQALSGVWRVTLKIDGVRAISNGVNVQSKHGKPLYNCGHMAHLFSDAEIFLGDIYKTVSVVCASKKEKPIKLGHIYQLDPPDPRLILRPMTNPTTAQIEKQLAFVISQGFEGLVLRQGERWIKVKKNYTVDVTVTGIQAGKGKHTGKMGALLTANGRVGTGYTDEQRVELNDPKIIGTVIEVQCMEITPDNKFRHARFIRTRPDK